ncbi:MAG TPA: ABC transporter substrate-binding protein [Burkholderiales bacterium]|nr:ABC transporter substrate-binding protein [Burkholderiales bacterium]
MARQLLIGLMAALCAAAVPTAAQSMTSPDALAKSVTEEVLAVLRTDKDIQSGNHKKVIDLVEKKVLPHFNFVRMTQLAVGRHWRDASPEQRKQLVEEFRTLLVQTYAATLTAYRDQTIEVRPLRMQPDETDVVVRSLINQSGGKPVTVDYKMNKSDTGWKVYDVVVGDLSLVQSYRGSFNTEVQKGGINGLVKTLSEKNKQLVSRQ